MQEMIGSGAHKKAFEKYLLERFISHPSHGLRIKNIIENETPDFVVSELSKDISIELTQLILPELKETERFQEKIVSAAWQKFRQRHQDNLQVFVNFFNLSIHCSKNDSDKLAEDLLEIVERVYQNNKNFEFRISSIGKQKPIHSYIESIVISNDLGVDNWQPFGAFRVNPVDINWVKKVIAKKEKIIKQYNKKCDEDWLLLLANFGHKSSTQEFDYLILEDFQSLFDRIYLYKFWDNTYTRLC